MPHRYLVVDDSPTVRFVLASALRQAAPGSEITECSSGEEAVAKFRAVHPDVVFLDMMLGADRGTDVMRRILEEKVDQRVVLLTGLPPGDPSVVSAVSDGAFAYLQKPVRAEAIRSILDAVRNEAGGFQRIR